MKTNLQLRAYPAPWRQAVEFLLHDGKSAAEEFVLKERDPAVAAAPSFQLSYEQAQTLMDDLWNSGLRPTEGTGSAGALAATQKHLEDMRRLVFEQAPQTQRADPFQEQLQRDARKLTINPRE